MPEILQHALVTVVALGAAATIVRRVFASIKPGKGPQAACASCPSAKSHGRTPQAAAATPDVQPLTLVRRT
jgi:hypothetical protein